MRTNPRFVVSAVSCLSVFCFVAHSAPAQLPPRITKLINTGTADLLDTECPQSISLLGRPVEVVELLSKCHANRAILELFSRPREKFLSTTSSSTQLQLICNGLVALMRDIALKEETAAVCKDNTAIMETPGVWCAYT